eukprot:6696681-Alexandrium_andersonii.AAC.1
MSASLVGSEMCIRDSCLIVSEFCCFVYLGRQTGSRGGMGGGQKLGAVSYTHLTLPTICSV